MFVYNQPIKLPDKNTFYLQFGHLELWIIRQKESVAISYSYQNESVGKAIIQELDTSPIFPENAWQRYMTGSENEEVIFSPVWGESHVVVRPSMMVVLPPHSSTTCFVEMPLSLQIKVAGKNLQLCTVITSQLSNTWFGSMDDGELCLSLKTPAKNHFEDLLAVDHNVIMPLTIVNKSQEDLSFRHIKLCPIDFPIWQGDSLLWTAAANIQYQGKDKWSRISFDKKEPKYESLKELLRKGNPKDNSILRKTFDNVFNFSNFQYQGG